MGLGDSLTSNKNNVEQDREAFVPITLVSLGTLVLCYDAAAVSENIFRFVGLK